MFTGVLTISTSLLLEVYGFESALFIITSEVQTGTSLLLPDGSWGGKHNCGLWAGSATWVKVATVSVFFKISGNSLFILFTQLRK